MEPFAPLRVASLSIRGPYERWGKHLVDLIVWMQEEGIAAAGPPLALLYDNPLETPADELRSEACMPVGEDAQGTGSVAVKTLPGGLFATCVHRGPPERYTDTFGELFGWILSHGYLFEGPAREVYDKPSPDLSPGMGVSIQQLIRKK